MATLQIEQKLNQIISESTEENELLRRVKQDYDISDEQLQELKKRHKKAIESLDTYFLVGIICHDWSEMESFLSSFL